MLADHENEKVKASTRIRPTFKKWLAHRKAELGKTLEELYDDVLTFFYWFTTDLEDEEQSRQFVQIRNHVLQMFRNPDNPVMKQRLRDLRVLLNMNGVEPET